jgi:hypothetical protein
VKRSYVLLQVVWSSIEALATILSAGKHLPRRRMNGHVQLQLAISSERFLTDFTNFRVGGQVFPQVCPLVEHIPTL